MGGENVLNVAFSYCIFQTFLWWLLYLFGETTRRTSAGVINVNRLAFLVIMLHLLPCCLPGFPLIVFSRPAVLVRDSAVEADRPHLRLRRRRRGQRRPHRRAVRLQGQQVRRMSSEHCFSQLVETGWLSNS